MDITTAEARALESLCQLLESADEKVILKAATEILRRITAAQRLAARKDSQPTDASTDALPPSPVTDGRGQPSAVRAAGEGAHPKPRTSPLSSGRRADLPSPSPVTDGGGLPIAPAMGRQGHDKLPAMSCQR